MLSTRLVHLNIFHVRYTSIERNRDTFHFGKLNVSVQSLNGLVFDKFSFYEMLDAKYNITGVPTLAVEQQVLRGKGDVLRASILVKIDLHV